MKVYVCYNYFMYEGCSEPLAVFDTKEKAEAWKNNNSEGEYEELEVE